MKKCFLFGNLLLSPALPPEPAWLSALLIGKDETLLALFFAGLVASVAVTGGLLIWGAGARRRRDARAVLAARLSGRRADPAAADQLRHADCRQGAAESGFA